MRSMKKFGIVTEKEEKYVVRESRISGIWATNCAGVTLDNGCEVSENCFDLLFTSKSAAIDWCLVQNQRNTVKIYGENLYA